MSSTVRLYFPDEIQSDLSSHLPKEQTHYLKDVMRLKIGDKLSIFNILGEFLTQDNPYTRIEVRNFGVFESKPTKAKPRARNPRTNEEIYVPAHKKTRFKPGKVLKAHLRKPI